MKLFAILSSVLSITSRTSINAIIYLILLFLFIAAYMCIISASYLGLTYTIVYVGAISILFLFVVMMLNMSKVEVRDTNARALSALPLGFILVAIIRSRSGSKPTSPWSSDITSLTSFTPNRVDNIALYLYVPNARWLLILGVLFLVAMVGSIVLCLKPLQDLYHTKLIW